MTKSEQKELKTIERYLAAGLVDTAARGAAALLRAASPRSAREIRKWADARGLATHPEFIA
jgi:hypothetical protein